MRGQLGSLRELRVSFAAPCLGFSITQLQRKQAMLNASKQQAIGKPKGKQWWSYLHPWQPGPHHNQTVF